MSKEQIVRAWKDQDYRESLSDAQRSQLPSHPAGLVEITDADSDLAAGASGWWTSSLTTIWCCRYNQ